MNLRPQISDDEFAAYVFGSLPPERRREIERKAAEDDEFAAEIELFRMLFRRGLNRTGQLLNAEE